jgi:hypothetical protein
MTRYQNGNILEHQNNEEIRICPVCGAKLEHYFENYAEGTEMYEWYQCTNSDCDYYEDV